MYRRVFVVLVSTTKYIQSNLVNPDTFVPSIFCPDCEYPDKRIIRIFAKSRIFVQIVKNNKKTMLSDKKECSLQHIIGITQVNKHIINMHLNRMQTKCKSM